MPDSSTGYQQHIEDISSRAAEIKQCLVETFRLDDGTFMQAKNREEGEKIGQVLESAIKDTPYSLSENGGMIAGFHARALQGYERVHGHLPSDELLASAHKAIENALKVTNGKTFLKGTVFEAADMSTTEGILLRDRLISLVLPVYLQMITGNMSTFIPGEFNQSEFFRIKRVAGSNFGGLSKGDIIDYDYDGEYSVMNQRTFMGKGNGTTTAFTHTAGNGSVVYPLKNKRTRIWVNHQLVARDTEDGSIAGNYQQGGATIVVSGTVNYQTGKIDVSFSAAPKTGDVIDVGYDVNIEQDPTLIPRVDHQMFSRVLYPHESAISGNATIQAIWTLRRELGQDIDNLTMQALRNLLAADKDRKHLHDMLYHATNVVEWPRRPNEHLTLRENYETLNKSLLEVDSVLMLGNGVSGLVGIVGGVQAVNVFRYLPSPLFVAAPGYRSIAQPHYVGRVFGQWDLYCNPRQDEWTCLCFAKGPDHGQTAYVVGDAVPALTFKHPVLTDLVQRGTMWDLAYRDMQPFDGDKYLCKLIMTDE